MLDVFPKTDTTFPLITGYASMRRFIRSTAILAIAALFVSCTEEQTPLQPLSPAPDAGIALVGTVVDLDGAPVEDARIVLEPVVEGTPARLAAALEGSRSTLARSNAPTRTVLTGENGRFRFEDVDSGDHLLTTDARDHLGAVTPVAIPPLEAAAVETVTVDVQLTPTGTIQGVVTLENRTSYEGTIAYVAGTSYVAVTDDEANFRIEDVPVGSWTVIVSQDDYVDQQQQVQIATAGQVVDFAEVTLLLDTNLAPLGSPALVPRPAGGENVFTSTNLAANGEDVDGTITLYEWDFDNDGVFDWSSPTTGDTQFQYETPGIKRPKLRLTDDDGAHALFVADPFEVFDAVYVSENGNDVNPGTRTEPVASLDLAVQIAATQLRPVIVAIGTYGTFTPVSGVDVSGGYDEATWTTVRDALSTINGPDVGLFFSGVTDIVLRDLEIVSADATVPGKPSIAVGMINCEPGIEFYDCVFRSGHGAAGAAGLAGEAGDPGVNGSSGRVPFVNPLDVTGAGGGGSRGPGQDGDGGNGGGGGYFVGDTWFRARDGSPGEAAAAGAGGNGGLLFLGSGCVSGSTGLNGIGGGNGVNGDASPPTTGLPGEGGSTPFWRSAFGATGTDGQDGSGGGGGAGAGGTSNGACTVTGAGGGGGGSGGTGGERGRGGQGGGASFAVALVVSEALFVDCVFEPTRGGQGGAGGNSGLGGDGGLGGAGRSSNGLTSGPGGDGGDGGDGGGGQGGPGGPAYGIFTRLATATTQNPTFVRGIAGNGGQGGLGFRFLLNLRERAPAGPTGESGDTLGL